MQRSMPVKYLQTLKTIGTVLTSQIISFKFNTNELTEIIKPRKEVKVYKLQTVHFKNI